MDEQSKQNTSSGLEFRMTNFDPDLSPKHPTNKEAAAQRGLVYNPHSRYYEDEDGCLIRDKFGQPY